MAGDSSSGSAASRRSAASRALSLSSSSRIGSATRKVAHAALTLAEQVAHAAQAQILARDDEAVVAPDEDVEPLLRLGADVAEQDAVRRLRAAPDAAAQLMQLRETEALGMLDEHHRRVGDVDPDLDHRRGDEDVDLAVAEAAHDRVALVGGNAAVQQRDAALP